MEGAPAHRKGAFCILRSVCALSGKTRGLDERLRLRAKARELALGSGHGLGKLRARRFDADERYERRLTGSAVLARRLAHRLRVAFRIEQIVRDLKSKTEMLAVAL